MYYYCSFKELQNVPTTTERSEICKYYFIEHFYPKIRVEFGVITLETMIVAAAGHNFGFSLWKSK